MELCFLLNSTESDYIYNFSIDFGNIQQVVFFSNQREIINTMRFRLNLPETEFHSSVREHLTTLFFFV